MIEALTHAISSAHRRLWRTPAVLVCGILCLTLGIGATTALSSAVSQALLRPLPFAQPDRLIAVHRVTPQSGPQGAWSQSPATFHDLAARATRSTSVAAITWSSAVLNLPATAVQASAFKVTANFFETLGARPQFGRLLRPADDSMANPFVVVVSDEFWRRTLGADQSIVGRSVLMDGAPTTIVGVLPRDFRVPVGPMLFRADVWRPIRFTPQEAANRDNNYLRLLARLAPGATVASAETELQAIFAGVVMDHPELRGEGIRVAGMNAENVQSLRTPLLLLFGAVCLVLLIAATNVAALLLARSVQQRREVAVRAALGAAPREIMMLSLTDSLVLSAWGVALGIALSLAGVRTIGALAAERLPQLEGLGIDRGVLAFALCLGVVTAAVCGAVPAWRSAHTDPQDALRAGRGGGAGREHHRALRSLVIVEVALSLVLLLGAGLVLKGFARLVQSDPGFNPGRILTVRVNTSAVRYTESTMVDRFIDPAIAAVRAVPNVDAAAVISCVPYQCWGNNAGIRYQGQPATDPSRRPIVEQRQVTPGFFDVTRQRLLAGRVLLPTDDERAPAVAVVNQALAKRDLQGRSPVGRRFYTSDSTFGTIVGVVSDVKNAGPVGAPQPEMYSTLRQSGGARGAVDVMIRTRIGDPMSVMSGVREAVRGVDPTAALSNALPMTEVISQSLGRPRFYLSLLAAFAGIGMMLAMAGLYGVLSYVVAQRTRELGIRSALGGTRTRIAQLIAKEGLTLAAIGIALGFLGAAGVTRLMVFMLYGVNPLDTMTWIGAAAVMVVVAVAAAVIPVYRASLTDPLVAMRSD